VPDRRPKVFDHGQTAVRRAPLPDDENTESQVLLNLAWIKPIQPQDETAGKKRSRSELEETAVVEEGRALGEDVISIIIHAESPPLQDMEHTRSSSPRTVFLSNRS